MKTRYRYSDPPQSKFMIVKRGDKLIVVKRKKRK